MPNTFVHGGLRVAGETPGYDPATYVPIEYPKWVYPADKEPFVVRNREEEDAAMADDKPVVAEVAKPVEPKAKRSK